MAQSVTSHVFISYSRRDDAALQRIVSYLRKRGITVWVDNEELIPGTPIWEEEIEKAIIGAGAVVVLLSPDSKNSPWVRREISYAEDHYKRIFPILIAGNEINSIPIRLTSHQRIDIRENEEKGLTALSTSLSNYLGELARYEAERKAREEADRLALLKTEDERIAAEKLKAEQLAKQKADEERLALEKAEAEALLTEHKAEEESKGKTEVEQPALQKTEAEYKGGEELRQTQVKNKVVEQDFDSTKTNVTKPTEAQVISLRSWQGRVLLGAVLGAMIGMLTLVFYILDQGWRGTALISFISIFFVLILIGGLSGLIIYPNRLSLLFILIGIYIVERIYYDTTARYHNDPPLVALAQYIAIGFLFGIPPGALLSRILYWAKNLK